VVKKIGSGCFKISHEKFRAKNAADQEELYQRLCQDIAKYNPDIATQLSKAVVSVPILFILFYTH